MMSRLVGTALDNARREKFEALIEDPLIGEARTIGMMRSIALTAEKASRANVASDEGIVGLICRERCFAKNLVVRHVGDRMIISPPLVISKKEIDVLIARAWKSLDECHARLKEDGLLKAGVES